MTYHWTDQPPSVPTKPGEYWAAKSNFGNAVRFGRIIRRGPTGRELEFIATEGESFDFQAMENWQFAGPIVIAEKQEADLTCLCLCFAKCVGQESLAVGWKCKWLPERFDLRDEQEAAVSDSMREYPSEPSCAKLEAVPGLPDGLELYGVWYAGDEDSAAAWVKVNGVLFATSRKEKASELIDAERRSSPLYSVRRMHPPEPPEEPQHPLLAAVDFAKTTVPSPHHWEIKAIRDLAESLLAELAALKALNAEMRAMLERQYTHHDIEEESGGCRAKAWHGEQARQIRDLLARAPGGGE